MVAGFFMASNKNTNGRRKIFYFSRTIHIYTSTYLFGLLVFFCFTGITLNHKWYGSVEPISVNEIALDGELLGGWGLAGGAQWSPDLNKISDYFKDVHGFSSPHSIDIDEGYGEVILNFKVPAGFATAIISAPENNLVLEVESGALLGVLNDLHKGRHSGAVWFWVIDVSAVLMCVFAISGMIILFQGKKFRFSGSLLALFGLLSPVFVFIFFVPKVSI